MAGLCRSGPRLGTLLAEKGIALVYGGSNIGLMGVIADAALAAGGEVIGVLPESLVLKEVAHSGLTIYASSAQCTSERR